MTRSHLALSASAKLPILRKVAIFSLYALAKKQKNWQSSEFWTKFQKKVYYILEIF